ncbi:MAG: hypothetical protein ACREKS_19160 [Candidatus Rokuibacteriota bacterium]
MASDLPLSPTSVCGSHALPSWLHPVREAEAGERLGLVPDCGLWDTPRWVAVSKRRSMVDAARLLRRELSGRS